MAIKTDRTDSSATSYEVGGPEESGQQPHASEFTVTPHGVAPQPRDVQQFQALMGGTSSARKNEPKIVKKNSSRK